MPQSDRLLIFEELLHILINMYERIIILTDVSEASKKAAVEGLKLPVPYRARSRQSNVANVIRLTHIEFRSFDLLPRQIK